MEPLVRQKFDALTQNFTPDQQNSRRYNNELQTLAVIPLHVLLSRQQDATEQSLQPSKLEFTKSPLSETEKSL
ncbi:hypothetical protein PPTG_24685 [Phytophthora nicotianae INRA-310]|uniref:Uncharacterized protein n=1 Tax=Phytophthora nicotianae (strain INRA-310) TaxID=761204 RepID=W2PC70_PHYN3|nr:hypothetical protein PPTG_24685 [Phytophthora nicotianae INRA-310]ETM98245.1 hypothetical protein PPTG_24685 [Phytophthora nicotianae INRA-310]